jgi:hypothetical protein
VNWKISLNVNGEKIMTAKLDEFNKKLKEKLEKDFGKKFVEDKMIIMSLDDLEDDEDASKI